MSPYESSEPQRRLSATMITESAAYAASVSAEPKQRASAANNDNALTKKYVCALCQGCRPTKRSNIEQHVWQKHSAHHGGDSYLHRYRASDHKNLVARFVREVPPEKHESGAVITSPPAQRPFSPEVASSPTTSCKSDTMEGLTAGPRSSGGVRRSRSWNESGAEPARFVRRLLSQATGISDDEITSVASPALGCQRPNVADSDAVLAALAEFVRRGDIEIVARRSSPALQYTSIPGSPVMKCNGKPVMSRPPSTSSRPRPQQRDLLSVLLEMGPISQAQPATGPTSGNVWRPMDF